MHTDPIADMLTRIRNGQAVKKESVEIPFSNLKHHILQCLEAEGFIERVMKKKKEKKFFLIVFLKYDEKGVPKITEIKRVSSPGQRVYQKNKEIRGVRGGSGVSVISTPKGVITNKDAKKEKLGGEVICEVW